MMLRYFHYLIFNKKIDISINIDYSTDLVQTRICRTPVCDVGKDSGDCCPDHWVLVRDRLARHDGNHPAAGHVLHHPVERNVAILPQEPVRLPGLQHEGQSDLLQVGLHAALQLEVKSQLVMLAMATTCSKRAAITWTAARPTWLRRFFT